MRLIKTATGKDALLNRDIGLKPRMRQILILANGTHSRDSIQDLMERDIGAELYWLLQCGYVEEAEGSPVIEQHSVESEHPIAAAAQRSHLSRA
jgi:hypothetical protein